MHFGVMKSSSQNVLTMEANLNLGPDNETEEMKPGVARGDTCIGETLKRQNFALCFGCKPSGGILAQT